MGGFRRRVPASMSCVRGLAEMRQTAERTAALEQEVRTRQQAENDERAWHR